MGDKVKIVPSFYDCLAPKSSRRSRSGYFMPVVPKFEDIPGSSSHLCNSMTDSEVIRCNNRLLKKDSEVGGKI